MPPKVRREGDLVVFEFTESTFSLPLNEAAALKQQLIDLIKDDENPDSMEYLTSPIGEVYQGVGFFQEESEKPKKPGRPAFKPPTLGEVKAYCEDYCHAKGYQVSSVCAERFFGYWEQNDWKHGRKKLSNWKQALRNWVLKGIELEEQAKKKGNGQRQSSYEEDMRALANWRMPKDWLD